MNDNYFNVNEKKDWELLEQFNAKTGLFNEIKQAEVKYHTDGTGYTVTKLGETKYWNIELKFRNLNLLNDKISGATSKGTFIEDTIYIEGHKVADMLLDCINGLTPLYINFLQDGTTIIFNLTNLKKRPKKTATMAIKSNGYQKFEIAKRQGLYLTDAAIYDQDGKLIKKAGEEFSNG